MLSLRISSLAAWRDSCCQECQTKISLQGVALESSKKLHEKAGFVESLLDGLAGLNAPDAIIRR